MQSGRDNKSWNEHRQIDNDARLSYFKEIFIRSIRSYRRNPSGEICVSGNWISLAQGPHGMKRSSSIEGDIKNSETFDELVRFLYQQIVLADDQLASRDYKKQVYEAASYYGGKAYVGLAWGLNSLAGRAGFNNIMSEPPAEKEESKKGLEGSKRLLTELVKSFDFAIGEGFHGEINTTLDLNEVYKLNEIMDNYVILRSSVLKDDVLQPASKDLTRDVRDGYMVS